MQVNLEVVVQWDDDRFYRGVVEDVIDSDLVVRRLDYGDSDLVEADRVFQAQYALSTAAHPPLALHCRLQGWPDREENDCDSKTQEAFEVSLTSRGVEGRTQFHVCVPRFFQELFRESADVRASFYPLTPMPNRPNFSVQIVLEQDMLDALYIRTRWREREEAAEEQLASISQTHEDDDGGGGEEEEEETTAPREAASEGGGPRNAPPMQDAEAAAAETAPVLDEMATDEVEKEAGGPEEGIAANDEPEEQIDSRGESPVNLANLSHVSEWLSSGAPKKENFEEITDLLPQRAAAVPPCEPPKSPRLIPPTPPPLPETVDSADVPSYKPASFHGATCSFVLGKVFSPAHFFVFTGDELEEHARLSREMEGILLLEDGDGDGIENLPAGSMLAVREAEEWHRAELLSAPAAEEGMIKVLFVDIGETEDVGLDCVKILDKEFCSCPKMAVRCRLAGVVPPCKGQPFSKEVAEVRFRLFLSSVPPVPIVFFLSLQFMTEKCGDSLVEGTCFEMPGDVALIDIEVAGDDGSSAKTLLSKLLVEKGLAGSTALIGERSRQSWPNQTWKQTCFSFQ